MTPDNPNCASCGKPHGLTMADLTEPDPSLPVYCWECECAALGEKPCHRCGQWAMLDGDRCEPCRKLEREPQGEAVRLFEPAPTQMPGQMTL